MRIAFTNALFEIIKNDKKVILLTADLGYSVFEELEKKYPRQFVNVGIAEQNMTGLAAGMAIEGLTPVIYSIVPFSTMRNFEQIRNDICYQNLNVKIVGVGAGFSYGPYGHTHHGLEDIAILRPLPNLEIYSPGDPAEADAVTKIALKRVGPAYIRLGRAGEPAVHEGKINVIRGKAIQMSEGNDVGIFSSGAMLYTANKVKSQLQSLGISTALFSMPTIKPLDTKAVVKAAHTAKLLVSIEEHFAVGGLGSAISECLTDAGSKARLLRIGVPDSFTKVIGAQEFMRKANGLDPDSIVAALIRQYKKYI